MEIPIIFHKTRNDAVRKYEQEEVRTIVQSLAQKLHAKSPIKRVEIGIDAPKNPAGKARMYDITLKIFITDGLVLVAHGKSQIAKTKQLGLRSALREGFKDLEAEYRKIKNRKQA